MPKGVKINQHAAPATARCDFCGAPFPPQVWNCRTCVRCAVRGAPDQSKPDYEAKLRLWQMGHSTERERREAHARKASLKQPAKPGREVAPSPGSGDLFSPDKATGPSGMGLLRASARGEL